MDITLLPSSKVSQPPEVTWHGLCVNDTCRVLCPKQQYIYYYHKIFICSTALLEMRLYNILGMRNFYRPCFMQELPPPNVNLSPMPIIIFWVWSRNFYRPHVRQELPITPMLVMLRMRDLNLDEIMGLLSVSSYQDTKTDEGENIISSWWLLQ